MLTIEKLNDFGANTAEGLSRCFGNEEFYLRLVNMICNEKNFDALKAAVDANDLDAAFEAVHALKGVLGNLSLTPMYEKSVEITELLRVKAEADYPSLTAELLGQKAELERLCE